VESGLKAAGEQGFVYSPGGKLHDRARWELKMLVLLLGLTFAPPASALPSEPEEEEWVRTVKERIGYEPPGGNADWAKVLTTEDSTIFYIDRSSLRHKGAYVTAWEKQDHRTDTTAKIREAKSLYAFDCVNRRAALKEFHLYFPDGQSDSTILTDSAVEWEPVKEGTIGPVMLEYVCKLAGR